MRDARTQSKPLPPPVPEDPVRCRHAEGMDSLVASSRPAVRNAAAALDRAACTAVRRIRPSSMLDPPGCRSPSALGSSAWAGPLLRRQTAGLRPITVPSRACTVTQGVNTLSAHTRPRGRHARSAQRAFRRICEELSGEGCPSALSNANRRFRCDHLRCAGEPPRR
jgi:hypothetical protein